MRTTRTAVRLLVLTLAATSLAAVTAAPSATAGTTIDDRLVKGGLNGPSAFTFLPNGRIVYLERGTGEVRILNPQTDAERLFFRITGVNGNGERGALGVAVHPKWPRQPFIYVYVTRAGGGGLKNQIVRIRSDQGVGRGIRVLVSTPASSSPYHNGGRIAFGPDGRLFAVVGDGHNSSNAQDRTKNLRGKILRMRADGGVPADNPFIGGRRTLVWAFGIRNSFGFAFDLSNRRLWETENGPGCNDEINMIVRKGNYAWGPSESCPNTNQDGPAPRRQPKEVFSDPIAITGAVFCEGCGLGFEGDLFFGAYASNGADSPLYRATLNPMRKNITNVINVAPISAGSIHSVEAAPNGAIHFSTTTGIYRLVAAA